MALLGFPFSPGDPPLDFCPPREIRELRFMVGVISLFSHFFFPMQEPPFSLLLLVRKDLQVVHTSPGAPPCLATAAFATLSFLFAALPIHSFPGPLFLRDPPDNMGDRSTLQVRGSASIPVRPG